MTTALATDTAALYLRISNDPAGERAGVERQRAECEALAVRLGLSVVDVYEDNDISAYSGKVRPDFERLLADAADGNFGTVVVWASDRLYRRMADLTRITEQLAPHARIVTVTGGDVDLSSAEGIMRAQVLGSVAEFESRRKGERVSARARQRATVEGRTTTGSRPYGWAWKRPCPGGADCHHKVTCTDGQRPVQGSRAGLVPHPVEAPAVAAAYRDIADGLSLAAAHRRLADRLGADQIMTTPALRGVLLSPRHAGLAAYHGEIIGEVPDGVRIVAPELWEQVRAILSDPSRRTSPGRPANTLLGGGLLRCGRCDSPMAASNKHDNRGTAPIYVCSRNYHMHRRRAKVEGAVLPVVAALLERLAGAGLLTPAALADDPATVGLRDRAAAAEARLDALAGLLAAGELDPRDYASAAAKVRADLEDVSASLARRTRRPHLSGLGSDPAAAFRQAVADGDAEVVRGVCGEVLERIVLQPGRGGAALLTWRGWLPDGLPTEVAV